MMTYSDYLDCLELFPEENFNVLIESLPNLDFHLFEGEAIELHNNMDDAAEIFLKGMIAEKWGVFTEVYNVNWKQKTFNLETNSLEDLEEIKNTFSKWTIANYEDLKTFLEEEEEEDKLIKKRADLLETIRQLPIETLESIVESIKK